MSASDSGKNPKGVTSGYTIGYTTVPVTHQPRAALRRARERKIVDATRALFDERGMQDARIDRIARRVGINKALIYRHFASKEELFVLTITRYLAEINALLEAVDEETSDPPERLRRGFEAFADYGIEHPAFLDCALSLLRQPAEDLRAEVSDAVWLRLAGRWGRASDGSPTSCATWAWPNPTCAPTSSTCKRSGSCISPAQVWGCARSRPAWPRPSPSAPRRCGPHACNSPSPRPGAERSAT